jgi:hypothetical protein
MQEHHLAKVRRKRRRGSSLRACPHESGLPVLATTVPRAPCFCSAAGSLFGKILLSILETELVRATVEASFTAGSGMLG